MIISSFDDLLRVAPTSNEADQSLQRMIESIKAGSFVPFDRQGQPMLFN